MNRREILGGGAAILAAAAGGYTAAQQGSTATHNRPAGKDAQYGRSKNKSNKPLRILILGGTGFIGPHFVEALRARGHTLTLFSRGKRQPAARFPDIETLIGDRDGKIDAIRKRDWDITIDNSGFVPRHVQLTADALKDHVGHYIFISSISVYSDLSKPGMTEDAPLATLKDPKTEEITGETYGGLKVACEQVVERTFAERSAILRPTFIVGPGDSSDRFTYWPVRTARGGEMLAPGRPSDPIQFIDVRDLADFVVTCSEQRTAGTYNICNPPRDVTMGELLETSKRLSQSDAKFVWVDADFLEKQKVMESGEIPIWAPPIGEYAGATLISPARAVAKGLRFRDLDLTVRDTLAWHATRPKDQQQNLRAGLSPERERELLQQWSEAKRNA